MKGRIALTVGLAIGLALLVMAGLSGQAGHAQATCDRYVLGSDGTDAGACTTQGYPCKTIQYAIDQAEGGDTICVAYRGSVGPQTYVENLVIQESITLDGSWEADLAGIPLVYQFTEIACDPANVTIDADGVGRVISISGSIAPTIDCFTITGGDAANPGGNESGGGISSQHAAPIIINNIINYNYGCSSCLSGYGHGGGIYLRNAPATAVISNNLIAYNVADDDTWGQGGGIMLRDSDAQVLSNTIKYNRAGHSTGHGGGIRVTGGSPTIAENTIEWNVAGQGIVCHGGGISVESDGTVTIERNTISANDAIRFYVSSSFTSTGGGIQVVGNPTVTAIIRDNTLTANWASNNGPPAGYGGGMYLANLRVPSEIRGNYLEYNRGATHHIGRGGGIYMEDCEAFLLDNYFSDNAGTYYGSRGEGGALYLDDGAVLVQDNEMTDNYAVGVASAAYSGDGFGGGLAATGGTALVFDNMISGNFGTRAEGYGYGGGLYFHDIGIYIAAGNTIAGNIATAYEVGYGGGVAISGTSAALVQNTIAHNGACVDTDWTTGGTFGAGGGVYAYQSTGLVLDNYIHHNVAAQIEIGSGGGVYVDGGTTLLDRNTIQDNLASLGTVSRGGGVRLTAYAVFSVTNNIIARNMVYEYASGIGVASSSSGVMAHNTIAENLTGDGVGLHVDSNSHVTLYNNIIVTQTTGIYNDDVGISTVNASYTLFEGNGSDYGAGVTSISEIAGPALLDSDYRLRPGSNAIDAVPPLSSVARDIDNDPRPVGFASDVGADEYALKAYLPLVLRNH